MKKLIVVADWASDSLSTQELLSSTEGFLKESAGSKISFVSASSSTIHTAFLIAQVVATENRLGRSQETVLFQNTDPRLEDAAGAKFLILKLTSGLIVCGPNAGFDFSLIKGQIDQAFTYTGEDIKTQFRSRDFYARACAYLMDYLEDEMDLEEVSASSIPTLTGSHIGHVDNFGNIKTTLTAEVFKGKYDLGDMMPVVINKVKKEVRYVSGLFAGNLGELVIYPGSSGPRENPYLEISVWRHFTEENPTTGLAEFGNPRPGAEIQIKGL